eukprot:3993157-Pleurochrysis_carterae.AAC.3
MVKRQIESKVEGPERVRSKRASTRNVVLAETDGNARLETEVTDGTPDKLSTRDTRSQMSATDTSRTSFARHLPARVGAAQTSDAPTAAPRRSSRRSSRQLSASAAPHAEGVDVKLEKADETKTPVDEAESVDARKAEEEGAAGEMRSVRTKTEFPRRGLAPTDELSAYELERLANIARNEEVLRALELDVSSSALRESARSRPKPTARGVGRPKEKAEHGPIRRSGRHAGLEAEFAGGIVSESAD